MAQGIARHDFQKLESKAYQVDEKGGVSNHSQPSSTKHVNDIREGTVEEISADRPSSALPDSDLVASWHTDDDVGSLSTSRLDLGTDSGGVVTEGRGRTDTGRAEDGFRARGTSISFNPQATSDDGSFHSLEQPLAKSGSLSRRRKPERSSTKDSIASQTGDSPRLEPDRIRINPFTGEPIRRRSRRSDAVAQLETINSQGDGTPFRSSDNISVSTSPLRPKPLSNTHLRPWLLQPLLLLRHLLPLLLALDGKRALAHAAPRQHEISARTAWRLPSFVTPLRLLFLFAGLRFSLPLCPRQHLLCRARRAR